MENSCKQKVFRRLCENAVLWGHAAHWERMGDPEKALGFLKEFHPANLYEEVSTELQMGNCYKKLSRIKEAAECFQFVRENGNKLHAVIRAEEQLSVLEAAMNKGGSL